MSRINIFRMDEKGPLWLEDAETVNEARKRISKLNAVQPAEFLIFDEESGLKLSLDPATGETRQIDNT